MKVLHLSTYHQSGGAAIAASRLNQALNRAGLSSEMLVSETRMDEPTVTSLAQTTWQKRWATARFALDRLTFLPFERSRDVRFAFSPALIGTDISQHLLVQQADILHLHWTTFGFLSTRSLSTLFALQKPVVWTMHDMWSFTGGCHHSGSCEGYQHQCGNCPFLRLPAPDDLSNSGWLRKQTAYQNARLTPVGCSQWLAKRARQSSLFGGLSVQSIPNPLDTKQFIPLPKAVARWELKLPDRKRFILFAAAKVSALGKGFSYFQKALHQLRQQLAQPEAVELLIFGGGDESLLQELPFTYHFLGSLKNPRQIMAAYSAADLFVIPSLEENLPNTIMESMACGTPVVGFEVGGIPEMIQHQQNGYLVQYRSVDDLARGMQWVLEQPEAVFSQLAANARNYVVANYDEIVIARRYIDLYGVITQG
ncbi:glycosyltransferase family 4 protein [Larkinella rosea]|uniref:Glycosyltransferase n=1 Tax=Larkinella rosea TaxID=2025312 RepID=A0A3P1BLW1_9BACT|nr:glycosyltransferase family 4 protein [Larkinella rosea]RRB02009.1 glycosyltransferase [Larkinella rosea]